MRREIINQLMCNNKLDIKRLEQKWGIKFNIYFESALVHLRGMAGDGLLELSDEWIRVTPEGRLLARTICMEFDRYLQESKKEQHYSRVI